MARIKRSERAFLDADGNEVERMEEAAGARFTWVDGDKEVKSWDLQSGLPVGDSRTMHMILGWHTKLGNVGNTVVNDKEAPGTPDEAAIAITEHVENCEASIWREVGEGVARGPKYDPAIMGAAIYEAAVAEGLDVSKTSGPELAERYSTDKSWAAKVRARSPVQIAYHRLAAAAGKGGSGMADLL
jgi:hypothetical protein